MNLKIKKKFREIDIFNPYIIVVGILLFILISIPMLYFSEELPRPSFQVYYFITIGVLFFILGVLFPKILYKVSKVFRSKINLIKSRNMSKLNSIPIFKSYSSLEFFVIIIVLIGIILQIANLAILGGIPLFSGILKAEAATKIWLFSYIFFIIGINILLAKFNRKTHYILLIAGLILFTLTGYRTTPIAILLSTFITLYYSRNIKLKYQILIISIIAILLIIIGFIAIKSIEWQQWRLNALELISYRAGFTINILDKATYLAGHSGGNLFYYTLTGFFKSIDPRVVVGEIVIGENHSITSTIFGPAILDFGWMGLVVQMFLIGFILKLLHIIQKHVGGIATAFYGILLGQTLIWIETGPNDLVVWLFYLLGIITIFYYIFKAKFSDETSKVVVG